MQDEKTGSRTIQRGRGSEARIESSWGSAERGMNAMKLNPTRVALLAGISLLAATGLLRWWLQKPGPYPCLAGRPSSLMDLMIHY